MNEEPQTIFALYTNISMTSYISEHADTEERKELSQQQCPLHQSDKAQNTLFTSDHSMEENDFCSQKGKEIQTHAAKCWV